MKTVDQITYERTRNTVKVGLAALLAITLGLLMAAVCRDHRGA